VMRDDRAAPPAPILAAAPPAIRAGFTLLEVTVAMAVLALGLVAVVDINAGAARLHEASRHLTVATLLARGKMLDLEQKLNEEGFSDFDTQLDGLFDTEGHPDYRWHAEILKPDLSKSAEQLTTMITGALGGGATTGGAGGGVDQSGAGALAGFIGQSSLLPANGQLPPGVTLPSSSSSSASAPTTTGLSGFLGGAATGLIQQQVQSLVDQLQKGVREVRLTVYWPEGRSEDSLSIATHLVVLAPTGAGTSGQTPPGQGTATTPGAPGAPALPGIPAMPGLPVRTMPGAQVPGTIAPGGGVIDQR
jgi:general secretion pathway protein I